MLGRQPDIDIPVLLSKWEALFDIVPTTATILRSALSLARQHRFQHWDSVIVAASVDAGCSLLVSEDIQHGFVWRGLTIVDPFAAVPHPILASLFES